MKLNRRNTIIGLGTIVAGSGAALGSGAFSSTQAQRELEVNVVTGTEIAEDFVDIILREVDTIDTFDVEGPESEPGSYFPNSSHSDDYGSGYEPKDGDISLMQNDVKLVFGPTDNELPPNSDVNYDGLITLVNEQGDEQDFNVDFSVEIAGGDSSFTFNPTNTDVGSNDTENVNVTIDTGSENQTDGELTIEITEATI